MIRIDHQYPTSISGGYRYGKLIHLGSVPAPPSDRGTTDTNNQIHTSNLLLEVLVPVETVDAGRDCFPSHLDHPCDAHILKRF